MKHTFLICCFLVLIHGKYSLSSDENLEEVNEEELLQLVKDEKYVLILFMKDQQCRDTCQQHEKHLVSLREELAEALGAWVIRCHAPAALTRWGGDASTPADTVVFVRLGKPMIYTGSLLQDQEILDYLLANKESNVRSLSDDTFEHETQASTGATTGDWLVVFTKDDCELCDRTLPHIEAVAANLRTRKNVALLHREGGGAVTARRFGVTEFPAAILFRLGRLYRYPHSSMRASDLGAFAEDTFRNVKAEDIPKPKTPFDDVTQAAADWLRENPYRFLGGVAGCLLVIVILVLLNSPPPESWTKQNKKKKKQ